VTELANDPRISNWLGDVRSGRITPAAARDLIQPPWERSKTAGGHKRTGQLSIQERGQRASVEQFRQSLLEELEAIATAGRAHREVERLTQALAEQTAGTDQYRRSTIELRAQLSQSAETIKELRKKPQELLDRFGLTVIQQIAWATGRRIQAQEQAEDGNIIAVLEGGLTVIVYVEEVFLKVEPSDGKTTLAQCVPHGAPLEERFEGSLREQWGEPAQLINTILVVAAPD
jgi:hypothetical protein